MYPKSGAPMETDTISRPLISISCGVSSKGPLPQRFPHRAPLERDAPLLESSVIHLSKSLVYEPPSMFPTGAPMERDAHLQSIALHILQGPQ